MAELWETVAFESNCCLVADTDASGYGFFLDEDNMASNSATKLASQQSIKAYVDASSGLWTDHGTGNLYAGDGAAAALDTGEHNFIAGDAAGATLVDGDGHVLIGYRAGRYLANAGAEVPNVIIGQEAGTGTSGSADFSANTIIGYWTGNDLTSGSRNIILGPYSGDHLTSGYDNVLIGYQAGNDLTTENSQFRLEQGANLLLAGNFTTGYVGIATATPSELLEVGAHNGNITRILIAGDYSSTTVAEDIQGEILFHRISPGVTATAKPNAKISSVAETTDGDQVGLAFYTHPSTSRDANPVEAVRISRDGRLLIGDTATRAVGGNSSSLQVNGTAGADSSMSITRFSNNASSPYIFFGKSRGASLGTFTIVQNNDWLGQIGFYGADGSDLSDISARILSRVADTSPAANDIGGDLSLWTHPGDGGSLTERFEIMANGIVRIGVQTPPAVEALYTYNNYAGNAALFFNVGNSSNNKGIKILSGTDDDSGTNYRIEMMDGNGTITGSVTSNLGSTTYNTASDARAKKNIIDTTIKGIETVNAMRIVDHDWIKYDAHVIGGIVAQELLEVFPDAVSGAQPEDETTEEYEVERERGDIVDSFTEEIIKEDIDIRGFNRLKREDDTNFKDGKSFKRKYKNAKYVKTEDAVMGTRDRMLGISKERLVPVLIKAIQELSTKVELLESNLN